MNRDGWIKIYRKIHKENLSSCEKGVWMTMLTNAAYQKETIKINGAPYDIGIGELIFTVRDFAEECQIPTTTLFRRLQKFKELGYIDIYSQKRCTVVKIINYAKYQGKDDLENAEQKWNKVGTKCGMMLEHRTYKTSAEDDRLINYSENDGGTKSERSAERMTVPYPERSVPKQPYQRARILNEERRNKETKNIKEKTNKKKFPLRENSDSDIGVILTQIEELPKQTKKLGLAQDSQFFDIAQILLAVPIYRKKFDEKKDEAFLQKIQERYSLTISEMKTVAQDFEMWACDLTAKEIKSPRGTLNTFFKNHAERTSRKAASKSKSGRLQSEIENDRKEIECFAKMARELEG